VLCHFLISATFFLFVTFLGVILSLSICYNQIPIEIDQPDSGHMNDTSDLLLVMVEGGILKSMLAEVSILGDWPWFIGRCMMLEIDV